MKPSLLPGVFHNVEHSSLKDQAIYRAITEQLTDFDFIWDGRDGKGEVVVNGGYLCVVEGVKKPYKIAVLK